MFRALTPFQRGIDLAAAGIFVFLALPLELLIAGSGGGSFAPSAIVVLTVTIIMAAALALRRWSPALALGLAWLGAIVQMAAARPPGVVDLAVFSVLYTAAAYGSRLVFWAGLGSAVLGSAVITGYLFAGSWEEVLAGDIVLTTAVAVLVASLFALLLAWTTGALVRTGVRARENRIAQERAEQAAAAEFERVRIARDMHDVVAHSLAVVIAQADGARYAAASDPTAAQGALETISATARSALADVRVLLHQLRHREPAGPQPSLDDLEGLYAQVRAAGVALFVDVAPAPPGIPPASIQLAVYRILQEALTNALRHGEGSPVQVRLSWLADRVVVIVRNARPSDRPLVSGAGHHGLIGMRERAQLVGGTLRAGQDGEEFVVEAVLPIGGHE